MASPFSSSTECWALCHVTPDHFRRSVQAGWPMENATPKVNSKQAKSLAKAKWRIGSFDRKDSPAFLGVTEKLKIPSWQAVRESATETPNTISARTVSIHLVEFSVAYGIYWQARLHLFLTLSEGVSSRRQRAHSGSPFLSSPAMIDQLIDPYIFGCFILLLYIVRVYLRARAVWKQFE